MMTAWKNGHWEKDDQRISGRYIYQMFKERFLIELDVKVFGDDDNIYEAKTAFPVEGDTPEWDGWKLIREAELVNQIGG